MTTRWGRFARGWAAALFATLVAACSHTLGGGEAPSILALVLTLAFAGMVCVALAGKTLSRVRLAIAVGVSQFVFHAAFSLIGSPSSAPGGDPMLMSGHLESLPAAAGRMPMHDDPRMWLAHGVAAVITVLALLHGERAFWGMLGLARSAVRWFLPRMLAPAGLPVGGHNAVAVERGRLPRRLDVLLPALGRRGPPAPAAQH